VLCERLTDLSRLAERSYIADPKLDGQLAISSGMPRHPLFLSWL